MTRLFQLLAASVLASAPVVAAELSVVLRPSGETQAAPHGRGNIYAPEVVEEGGGYRMWFGGQGRDGRDRIHHTRSDDGVNWEPATVVLDDPTANHVNDPSVVRTRGGYLMYYTRAAIDVRDDIALATSEDGLHWKKQGVVLKPGVSGAWDSLSVGRPSVVVEEGVFRMWYDGRKDLPLGAPAASAATSASSTRAVGYAESADGITWTRPHAGPVFGQDAGGADVCKVGESYLMVFESRNGTQGARSSDGIQWTPIGQVLARSSGSQDRHGHVTPMLLPRAQQRPWLFFGAARAATWDENAIARAVLPAELDLP